MHRDIYIYIYTYTCAYRFTSTSAHTCIYIYTTIYTYMYMHTQIYIRSTHTERTHLCTHTYVQMQYTYSPHSRSPMPATVHVHLPVHLRFVLHSLAYPADVGFAEVTSAYCPSSGVIVWRSSRPSAAIPPRQPGRNEQGLFHPDLPKPLSSGVFLKSYKDSNSDLSSIKGCWKIWAHGPRATTLSRGGW